jgi:UDP-2,4-diacetamido-2,4,6-trideoxy-beta-L-altropyranose hydrolase
MDHYALDWAWQEAALLPGVRLLVLDDLADRRHVAEVLLDQNAGREARDYAGLVSDACDLRIGPAHALLRPEFIRLRPQALARRAALERPVELLITLGGIDKDNTAGRVLDALDGIPAAHDMRVTVIMGQTAPWLAEVQARAASMTMPTEVSVGVSDMAERMTRADLCIGAAGSTAWERCALGLPTLQVVLAENQLAAARYMAEQGLTLALPFPNARDFSAMLEYGLAQLSHPEAYHAMAESAAALTDGAEAARLAAHMLETSDGQ